MAGGLFTCISVRGHGGRAPALAHTPANQSFTWSEQMVSSLRPISSPFPGPLPAWALLGNYVLILAAELRTP